MLACFSDLASLSRAEPLALDLARQCSALEMELATAEAAVPAALAQANDNAGAALVRLGVVDEKRTHFEDVVKARLDETTQLASRLDPPCARLRRLREAQLVLHTLATADRLVEKVELAQQRTASDEPPTTPSGAQSPSLQALLQLHALRASVRVAVASSAAAASGASIMDGDEDGRAAAAVASLLEIIDARLLALEPPLREAFDKRAAKALTSLGWPAELSKTVVAPDSEALGEARAALSELLLLQYCCEASDQHAPAEAAPAATAATATTAAAAAEAGASSATSASGGSLWAMDALAAPVLRRFRYHFEGRRETNRRDKPEWMFQHVVSLLRLQLAFLDSKIQPMLLSALPLLHAVLRQPEAARAEAEAYSAMLRERCPYGVFAHVAGALCAAIRGKLRREQPTLLGAAQLFCHTLNETAAFDKELRDGLGCERDVPGARTQRDVPGARTRSASQAHAHAQPSTHARLSIAERRRGWLALSARRPPLLSTALHCSPLLSTALH